MAFSDSVGLLFRIKSDYDKTGTTQATADIKELEAAGTGAGAAFAEFASVAAIAVAAIAAVGAAAIVASKAIFNLAESSAEFGSRLFDVQQKTGLAAATLGALDIAAKQSGSSLEQISASTAKFSKLMGEAAQGNDKAQATLKTLGVTSNDLNTALDQVFHTINNAQEGVEQMTLAQKAFGRSGADLIPVIRQIDGDLSGATDRAKALGEVLSEEALRAADDFGDALADLRQQATVTAAKFGLAVAPTITAAMKDISHFIAENQSTITEWSQHFGTAMHVLVEDTKLGAIGVQQQFDIINGAIRILSLNLINGLAGAWNVVTLGAHNAAVEMERAANASRLRGIGNVGGGGVNFNYATSKSVRAGDSVIFAAGGGGGTGGGGRGGGRGGGGGGRNDAEAIERDRIAAIKASAQEEIQIKKATNDAVLASYKLELAQGTTTEEQEIDKRQALEQEFYDFKIETLQKELAAVQNNAKEKAAIEKEIALTTLEKERQQILDLIEIENQRAKKQKEYDADIEKAFKRQIDLAGERLKIIEQQLEYEKQVADQMLAATQARIGEGGDNPFGLSNFPDGESGNPFFDALFSGIGLDKMATNAQTMKGILGDFGSFVGDIFGQMAQAVGQSIASWVLYGGSIGKALKQATAAVLAQIAAQAAVKAIFQLAEGFAALFVNPPAAAAHFTAAAIYAAVAAVAGLSGRAIAGNSFKQSTAAGGSQASGVGSSDNSLNNADDPRNNFRSPFRGYQTQQATMADRQNAVLGKLDQSIDMFNQKFGIASAADVVMAGAKDAAGHITQAVQETMANGLRIGNNFTRLQGAKA